MEVNFVAAIVVAICSMAIGFVWYSKVLFANSWMKETGLTMEQVGKGPGMGYLFTTITSFIMGLVFSFLAYRLVLTQPLDGILWGLLIWLGFIFPAFAANYIFALKSKKLLLIDAGYYLATSVVAGLVVTLIK